MVPVLETCANKECKVPPFQYIAAIQNQMTLTIRKYIQKFYDNWLVCDDPNCNFNTRMYTHVSFKFFITGSLEGMFISNKVTILMLKILEN